MRILLVNYEYPPVGGGAATATQAIARSLVKAGHQAVVLTSRYKELPAKSGEEEITVYRVASLRRKLDQSGIFEMTSFLATGLICVPGIIDREQIEAVIVFFSLPCGPIGFLGHWTRGVPYVVSLRGGEVPGAESSLNLLHRILRPVRRAVLKNSVAIVANSEGLKKMAEAADPYPVRVIPNGVDTDFFAPAESRPEMSVLRILFVGRFQKQKNLPLLLQQAAQLPAGTAELHLVGDGPDREQLQQLAAELGIASTITWHGWLPRPDLRAVYQSSDCLVNLSLYEGLPNVVMEAMASGLPVVASNVPGNDALVREDETGFLFELNSPGALADALSRLRDRDTRLRMGNAARARALEFSSWDDVALRYVELFARGKAGRTENRER